MAVVNDDYAAYVQTARGEIPIRDEATSAEVSDIRVGFDGTTYESAGEAVREQVNSLKEDLVELDKGYHQIIFDANFQDDPSDKDFFNSDYLDAEIFKNSLLYADSGVFLYVYMYDKNKKYINIYTYNSEKIRISFPYNTKYIIINTRKNNIGKFKFYSNILRNNVFVAGYNIYDNGDLIFVENNNKQRASLVIDDFDGTNGIIVIPKSGYSIYATEFNEENENVISYTNWNRNGFIMMHTGKNAVALRAKKNDNGDFCTELNKPKTWDYDFCEIENINIANFDFLKDAKSGNIINNTGNIGTYSNGIDGKLSTIKYIEVINGGYLFAQYSSGQMYVFQYDENKLFISSETRKTDNNTLRKLNEKTKYIKILMEDYVDGKVNVKFQTNDGRIKWSCNARTGYETIPFAYQVYPNYQSYNSEKAFTSGLLRLPPNYSDDGEKVPLIYFAHGSGDYTSRSDIEFSSYYMDYIKYLQDEGFAIFDCFGWTSKDIANSGSSTTASPTNMACVRQGIKWVCNNFNIDANQIYVTGKSLGGINAVAMCFENGINVKACCPLAPEIDPIMIAGGYSINTRKSYANDLQFSTDSNNVLDENGENTINNFSTDFKNYFIENADKVIGYNPFWKNVLGVEAEQFVRLLTQGNKSELYNVIASKNRICNVPIKIFVAIDDNAVDWAESNAFVQSIKNTGGIAELRTMPANTGKHHAVDTDPNALKVASIITKCGVTHTNVPLAYAEMVQFFKQYC